MMNLEEIETIDFTEADHDTRVEWLNKVLNCEMYPLKPFNNFEASQEKPKYSIEFKTVREEKFPRSAWERNHSKWETYRQHYLVIITNNSSRVTETFEYFCGEKRQNEWPNRREVEVMTIPKRKQKWRYERLISFLNCIASDYGMIEHQGIKDGFDLIEEGLAEGVAARDLFHALQLSHAKVKRLFDKADFKAIESIVEGY